MAAQSAVVSRKKVNLTQVVFSGALVLLSLIIISQVVFGKSIHQVFLEDKIPDVDSVISYSDEPDAIHVKTRFASELIIEDEIIDLAALADMKATEIKASVVLENKEKIDASNEFKVQADLKLPSAVLSKAKNSSSKRLEKPSVIPTETVSIIEADFDAADKYYKDSLLSLTHGEYDKSVELIDKAIAIRSNADYLILKAQALIAKKDADSFYEFVIKAPAQTELNWLKVVAPGLQIFSFNQLSNDYYEQLIKREPNVIRWKLAIALNFIKLNEKDKAVALYETLVRDRQVSRSQYAWLNKRIQQLRKEGA